MFKNYLIVIYTYSQNKRFFYRKVVVGRCLRLGYINLLEISDDFIKYIVVMIEMQCRRMNHQTKAIFQSVIYHEYLAQEDDLYSF